MQTWKLLSWNVNGIRAIARKGFPEWVEQEKPDLLCVQETKASPDQVGDEIKNMTGYESYWASAEKKGYSGVAVFARQTPTQVRIGFGEPRFDAEGRTVVVEYPDFTLFNVYFPNGKQGTDRLTYKLDFYEAILAHWEELRRQGKRLIICGDVNTAHREIDLARPKENVKTSGFLPEERAWMDRIADMGYVDIFRRFNQNPEQYTWWDMVTRARERNVGWRIDYFYVTEDLVGEVENAWIAPEVMGSDHCPVGISVRVR
ncbi:MAG: exodeoxyribonuclease III [candidate division Zixibacteria bacterium]|nr:exodeoxyribonuclease III [candidate division Zixibacteria bacterium]